MTKGVEDGTELRPKPTGVMCCCCGHETFKNGRILLCDYCFLGRLKDSAHQCSKLLKPEGVEDGMGDGVLGRLAKRIETALNLGCQCEACKAAAVPVAAMVCAKWPDVPEFVPVYPCARNHPPNFAPPAPATPAMKDEVESATTAKLKAIKLIAAKMYPDNLTHQAIAEDMWSIPTPGSFSEAAFDVIAELIAQPSLKDEVYAMPEMQNEIDAMIDEHVPHWNVSVEARRQLEPLLVELRSRRERMREVVEKLEPWERTDCGCAVRPALALLKEDALKWMNVIHVHAELKNRERQLLASMAESAALHETIATLRAENIKLLNDASVWRNRAIGAEEEIREGGRGIDLRRGFER